MKKHFKKWSYYSRNHSYSMSLGAEEAYDNGRKPLSKWRKNDILDELKNQMSEEEFEQIKKLKLDELKSRYLVQSEWHHMGKYARRVYFYKVMI